MPLRDHFHGPSANLYRWETIHLTWPVKIVDALNRHLPPRYIAAPGAHQGTAMAVDVAAYERNTPIHPEPGSNGSAVETWSAGTPTLTLESELPDTDEYEVRVYDDADGQRELVAAVELVSPANKDRPDHRRAFAAKCAALLGRGVCVVVVDVVTARRANLYRELLDWLDREETSPAAESPLYATTLRYREDGPRWRLETWERTLALGEPLPTLPLWLNDELAAPLELGTSYEETCRSLRIE